jgi:RNA polymerase sigma factor (sigma-70 family)
MRCIADSAKLFHQQRLPRIIGKFGNKAAQPALFRTTIQPQSILAGEPSVLPPLTSGHVVTAGRVEPDEDINIVDLIPALRAFARTFCRDPSDADDLVQETLTKGLANLDKYERGTRMKSWLFTIMRNTFYTHAKTRLRESPGLADCASGRLISEPTQEWTVRSREVHEAINRLPPSKREVLVLIGVLGVSYEEAAEICRCAVGTVKSRLNRARATILEHLGEDSAETLVEQALHLPIDHLDPERPRRR